MEIPSAIDLAVYIYHDGKQIAVTDYSSFIWTDRYFELGDCEIVVPYTVNNASKYKVGDKIKCTLSSRVMLIETIIISYAPESGKQMRIIGTGIESVLNRRVVPCTAVYTNAMYTSNKLIKALNEISTLCFGSKVQMMSPGNGYDPNGWVSFSSSDDRSLGLSFNVALSSTLDPNTDNSGKGQIARANINIDATGKDFLSILEDICKLYQFGYKLYEDGTIAIYDGRHDTVNSIIFSTQNQNLSSIEYSISSEKYKTYAFIQGDEYKDPANQPSIKYEQEIIKEDGEKTYIVNLLDNDLELKDQNSDPVYYRAGIGLAGQYKGMDRREVMINSRLNAGRNTPRKYCLRLQAEGLFSLKNSDKMEESTSAQLVLADLNGYKYETNYNLGDLVSVEFPPPIDADENSSSSNYLSRVILRITEFTISHTESGINLYPTLADFDPTAYDRANQEIEQEGDDYNDILGGNVRISFYFGDGHVSGTDAFNYFYNLDPNDTENWHGIAPTSADPEHFDVSTYIGCWKMQSIGDYIETPPVEPELEKATFTGWYIGERKYSETDVVPNGGCSYWAHYTMNPVNLTWNSGIGDFDLYPPYGGSQGNPERVGSLTLQIPYGDLPHPIPGHVDNIKIITPEGYSYLGFSDDEDPYTYEDDPDNPGQQIQVPKIVRSFSPMYKDKSYTAQFKANPSPPGPPPPPPPPPPGGGEDDPDDGNPEDDPDDDYGLDENGDIGDPDSGENFNGSTDHGGFSGFYGGNSSSGGGGSGGLASIGLIHFRNPSSNLGDKYVLDPDHNTMVKTANGGAPIHLCSNGIGNGLTMQAFLYDPAGQIFEPPDKSKPWEPNPCNGTVCVAGTGAGHLGISLLRDDGVCMAQYGWSWRGFPDNGGNYADGGVGECAFTRYPVIFPYYGLISLGDFRDLVDTSTHGSLNKVKSLLGLDSGTHPLFLPGAYRNSSGQRLWARPGDWADNWQNYKRRHRIGWYFGFAAQGYDGDGIPFNALWTRGYTEPDQKVINGQTYNMPRDRSYASPGTTVNLDSRLTNWSTYRELYRRAGFQFQVILDADLENPDFQGIPKEHTGQGDGWTFCDQNFGVATYAGIYSSLGTSWGPGFEHYGRYRWHVLYGYISETNRGTDYESSGGDISYHDVANPSSGGSYPFTSMKMSGGEGSSADLIWKMAGSQYSTLGGAYETLLTIIGPPGTPARLVWNHLLAGAIDSIAYNWYIKRPGSSEWVLINTTNVSELMYTPTEADDGAQFKVEATWTDEFGNSHTETGSSGSEVSHIISED